MIGLWDTTGNEVVKALAAERRSAGGVASGMALTLIVVVDEKRVREAEAAATAALPHFDVLLLGVGEDGHVASVFPEHPVAYETRPVSAVRGSPKPPPVRISLTLPAINTADEVWLIAAGSDKARSVGMALSGAGPVQLPAAGVQGLSRTRWVLDRSAAAEVKPRFRSLR